MWSEKLKRILGMIQKLENPLPDGDSKGIYGAHVATMKWIQSVIKYGSFDEYHIFVSNNEFNIVSENKKECVKIDRSFEKVKVFRFSDLQNSLANNRYIAFHNPRSLHYTTDLAHIRSTFSRNWFPITGVHHTLSYGGQIGELLPLLMSGLGKGDGLICTSNSSKLVLQKLIKKLEGNLFEINKLEVESQLGLYRIPLGVDCQKEFFPRDKKLVRKELNLPEKGLLFLCLGRLSQLDKADLSIIIRLFSKVVQSISDPVYLLIVGEDRYRYSDKLISLSNAYGIQDKVIIRTNPSNFLPKLYYCASDIFIAPTDNIQETFGITVIEAMASGLPVIVSDWDGYKDTVRHGITGFRIPTYWAPVGENISKIAPIDWEKDALGIQFHLAQSIVIDDNKMYEYMVQLANDRELRLKMGREARQHALSLFDWPRVISNYESLWDDLNKGFADSKYDHKTLYDFSYFDIFSHYPTKILNESDIVGPKKSKIGLNTLHFIMKDPSLNQFISATVASHILGVVDRPQKISCIFKKAQDFESEQVMHSILWLLKQGYLELNIE